MPPTSSAALPFDFIDSTQSLIPVIDKLKALPTNPPSLYLDLEGINLSRHGTISILQIHVPPNDTYLIDIHTLGATAFETSGTEGVTLKQILESAEIPKVIFDVRNDSDALHALFGIRLAGMQDLQLMELATRTRSMMYVNSLGQCIESHAGLSVSDTLEWKAVKDAGIRLFLPQKGGSYEVFNARPLAEEVRVYCVQDVVHMPTLWTFYSTRLTPYWKDRVDTETKNRVTASMGASFNGKGKHMRYGPW
ncbi:MAG: hypothetical protein Q9160_003068 [Pyrenula sp. 1 TL-2023]